MSNNPRPKISLQRKPSAADDSNKRGPLRSNGFKRHTGQGPGSLNRSQEAARASRPPLRGDLRNPQANTTPRDPNEERLNKRLAALGHCSRREADEWIAKGWVKINGKVAEMGQGVMPEDRIEVDQRAHNSQAQRATFVLHKPMGYVSGQAEDGHTNAASLLSSQSQWREDRSRERFSPAMLRGLAPAGRLDIDSTGLLILTQDGRVARHIIGEDSEVEKEYLVRVQWLDGLEPVTENVEEVFPPELLEKLRFGLELDGQPLRRADVDWQNPEQLRFVLREGKKRQIRRMCAAVGLKVVGLKRVRIGQLMLGHLPAGQWRFLGPQEEI